MPTILVKGFLACDTAQLSKDTAIGTRIILGVWALQAPLLTPCVILNKPCTSCFFFDFPSGKEGFTYVFIFSYN